MKEFMLLIRNSANHLSHLSPEENHTFLKACESYIERLKAGGHLLAAQPYKSEGVIISGSGDKWSELPFNHNSEVMVGYYHIKADSLQQAIELAKGNPEFRFTPAARIEVRPIKTSEPTTDFVYPTSN